MKITLADWVFSVDVGKTMSHTLQCSTDHCLCAYCRNFYEAVDQAHPGLRPFLARFGAVLDGPSELMPFEPTLVMACYRVMGRIVIEGNARMHVDGVPIRPEPGDNASFLLWVGEMELPWLQEEDMYDVVSPANEPEFMTRMLDQWIRTRDTADIS